MFVKLKSNCSERPAIKDDWVKEVKTIKITKIGIISGARGEYYKD